MRLRRREFIAGLGGAAAWPLAAGAQQGDRVRRIGYLASLDENDPVARSGVYLSAFTQALAGLGWTVGRNLRMDLRWGGDAPIAFERSRRSWSACTPTSSKLDPGNRRRPAGDADNPDRLREGERSRRQRHVPRFDRPGGNITGFATSEISLAGKRLELLSEIAPGLKRAAIMFNPETAPASAFKPSFETAA